VATPTLAPTQRTRQRDATRQQLLEAGLRVVAETGFAAATTAAIAKAMGKAHGTVFAHFATRELLVAELVNELGRSISQSLAAIPQQARSVADVLQAHLTALGAHEILYARLVAESTQLPPAARAKLFALQAGMAARLREAHAHELALGTVRVISSVVLANTWIALTNHYLMHRDLFAPGQSVIAARGEEMKAHMLELLRP
jgi:AcrR family transcriptional regulator